MRQNLIDSPRRSFHVALNFFTFCTSNSVCFDRMSVRLFTRRLTLIDISFGMFDKKPKLVVEIIYYLCCLFIAYIVFEIFE